MTVAYLQHILANVEPCLWAFALIAFWRAEDHRRFPALQAYLSLRVVSDVVLTVVLYSHRFLGVDARLAYNVYACGYYAAYIASAIALFFVIQELFKHAMAPLPGLSRIGVVAFRWAGVISVIVALATSIFPMHFNFTVLPVLASQLMHGVSILELCLLAFLAMSVQALGLSIRSRVFGLGLGFCMLSAMEFVSSLLEVRHPSLFSTSNGIAQIVTTIVLLTWAGYFLVNEPMRRPVMLPVTSPLLRLNEIAMALGSPPAQIAVGHTSDFFLQDVEKVVDKILSKNSLNTAG
jgi:hypothetical protein